MEDLSELELVAKAMAPTDPASAAQPTRPGTSSSPPIPPNMLRPEGRGPLSSRPNGPPPSMSDPTSHPAAPTSDPPPDPLSDLDLDLSSLSPSELAALQPLIQALRSSRPVGAGEDRGAEEGGEAGDVQDILRQMDVAEGVADDIEARVDGLLAKLGKVEEELGREVRGGGMKGLGDGAANGEGT